MLALLAGSIAVSPGPAYAANPPAEHVFSDPVWLPVRTPASIGCTNTACDVGPGHGFWAIDFTGRRKDPIYPAGAGIVHVGGNTGGCSTTGDSQRGRWVWVDHGAGVTTQYRHLEAITVKDGARVTPATQIGTMGGTGTAAPCDVHSYLYFDVRHNGVTGTPVHPGQLKACTAGSVVSLPAIYGATSWDDPLVHPTPRHFTPQANGTCLGTAWTSTPNSPTITVARGDRAATVAWRTPPSGTDAVVVRLEIWHPTVLAWGTPVNHTVAPSAAKTVLSGLVNGKTYRVSATFHNTSGNSTSSATREVKPAAKPDAPGKPRFLTWPKKDYVHYGWPRPAWNGSEVTSFTAARRCRAGSKPYGAWRTYTHKAGSIYINFRGLSKYSTCEVKVNAKNGLGTGPYSKTSTVRR